MHEQVFTVKPTVIGHRGSGKSSTGGQRENTIDSYLAAVSVGASWVEVDVRRTADDQLVVHHNPTTSDGDFIIDQRVEDVARKGVARFADVLAAVPAEVGLDLDVKTELEDAVCAPHRRTDALLLPMLAAEQDRRALFVSSFDPALLLTLQRRLPRVPLGLITWVHFPLRHAVPAAAHLGMQAVCLHTGSLGPNPIEDEPVHRPLDYSVRLAHEAGLEVLAWCPDASTATDIAAAGVDALCVNDVAGTLAALGAG